MNNRSKIIETVIASLGITISWFFSSTVIGMYLALGGLSGKIAGIFVWDLINALVYGGYVVTMLLLAIFVSIRFDNKIRFYSAFFIPPIILILSFYISMIHQEKMHKISVQDSIARTKNERLELSHNVSFKQPTFSLTQEYNNYYLKIEIPTRVGIKTSKTTVSDIVGVSIPNKENENLLKKIPNCRWDTTEVINSGEQTLEQQEEYALQLKLTYYGTTCSKQSFNFLVGKEISIIKNFQHPDTIEIFETFKVGSISD